MANFICCSGMIGRKKKNEVIKESSKSIDSRKALTTMKIRLEQPGKSFERKEVETTSFSVTVPFGIQEDSLNVKVMSSETPVGDEAADVAYEGGDEHEENASMKRDLSDLDLQAHVANSSEEQFTPVSAKLGDSVNGQFANKAERDFDRGISVTQTGHVSDPGFGKGEFWTSPKLKRSCSNPESSNVHKRIANRLPSSKSQCSVKWQEPGSPTSVMSHRSADRVMLKKHSSSQVLPSQSRKLWWKLFLWSHRNMHKLWSAKPRPPAVSNGLKQQGGYSSDTLELNRAMAMSKVQSPGSYTGESSNKGHNNHGDDNQSWYGFHGGVSGLWPQNQWVAFAIESSPLARVDEWVKDLEIQLPTQDDFDYNEDDNNVEDIVFPPSPEVGKSPAKAKAHSRHPDINLSKEILHANGVIQSLNSSSTVAHITGIGLKALPTISHFSSLRSVNLSNNFIVYITPGSLPKGLHTLNLSRNKINTIEGLRELTRLRLLDLSYNRISRIGQGLSNCTIIKELYLGGNKISDVEGLHRLLKLTILDLSFNKITTTKALGQLVANYNSLQALNLLGNPIQSNISDDQLRKAICSLLPKLAYLNKQPMKPQRAREVLTDSVAKAALGSSSNRSSHRRAGKRGSTGGSASTINMTNVAGGNRSKNRSKGRTHHLKSMSSAHASSSH